MICCKNAKPLAAVGAVFDATFQAGPVAPPGPVALVLGRIPKAVEPDPASASQRQRRRSHLRQHQLISRAVTGSGTTVHNGINEIHPWGGGISSEI